MRSEKHDQQRGIVVSHDANQKVSDDRQCVQFDDDALGVVAIRRANLRGFNRLRQVYIFALVTLSLSLRSLSLFALSLSLRSLSLSATFTCSLLLSARKVFTFTFSLRELLRAAAASCFVFSIVETPLGAPV